MGPIGCPETSVKNYRYSLRTNSEEEPSSRVYSMVTVFWDVITCSFIGSSYLSI